MKLVPDRVAGELAYRRALKDKDRTDFEGADACHFAGDNVRLRVVLADAGVPHPDWAKAMDMPEGGRVPYGGHVLKVIPGMGRVYDWRTSRWTPTNGGRIKPLVYVDHIPVIPQMTGIADFIRLRDVLVAQGLMVQNATDGEGNVALFTPLNYLCYQARGANSFSAGCEHMHYGTGDPWTPRQLNASSYVHWRAREYFGVPARHGRLAAGRGVVRVVSRGAVTHKEVSHFAGYNDRSDPGPVYERDEERVVRGVTYFDKHRNFKGF